MIYLQVFVTAIVVMFVSVILIGFLPKPRWKSDAYAYFVSLPLVLAFYVSSAAVVITPLVWLWSL